MSVGEDASINVAEKESAEEKQDVVEEMIELRGTIDQLDVVTNVDAPFSPFRLEQANPLLQKPEMDYFGLCSTYFLMTSKQSLF